MAAFTFRQRRVRRWWLMGVTLTIFALFAVVFVAASSANLPGSTFEGNDGNLVVNTAGNTDWDNAPNLRVRVDLPTGANDNSFGQGTSEGDVDVTVVDGSIPNSKADLARLRSQERQSARRATSTSPGRGRTTRGRSTTTSRSTQRHSPI